MEENKPIIDSGVCYIKPEFLGKIESIEKEAKSSEEPPAKRQKKEKKGGRNKNRPVFREGFDDKLCRSLVDGLGDQKCSRENCKFLHDVEKYLEKKPEDIGEKCPIYSTKGFCSFGITCRFGKEHTSDDFKNMNLSLREENEQRPNLSHELQVQLRKKTYDFSLSDDTLKSVEELINKSKNVGSCEDNEKIVTRPEEKKKIDFRNKLVLSPLTTVGNLPFRRICKEYGADITVGEMICSLPIINGSLSEWALTRRHPSEDIFGIQIEGNNAKLVTYAAQVLSETTEADFIDLNIGCPIDLIFQQGGGSALLRRQTVLEHIVRSCSQVLKDKPFTVKTRTGIYANKLVAKELLPKLEKWGASAVTLHGRTKEQRYTKLADWNYINECASLVENIPVIGNGDVFSFEDYQNIKNTYTNVSSVMIGRGALIKPWIFKVVLTRVCT